MAQVVEFNTAEVVSAWLLKGLRGYFQNDGSYFGFSRVGEQPNQLMVTMADRDSSIGGDVLKTVYEKLSPEKQAIFRSGVVLALSELEVVVEHAPRFEELFFMIACMGAVEFIAASARYLVSGMFDWSGRGTYLFRFAYSAVEGLSNNSEDAQHLLAYARSKYFPRDSWTGLLLTRLAKIDPENFSAHMDEFETSMTAQATSWGVDQQPPKNFAEDFIRSLGRERLLAVLATKGPAWDWLRNAIAKI